MQASVSEVDLQLPCVRIAVWGLVSAAQYHIDFRGGDLTGVHSALLLLLLLLLPPLLLL